MPLASKKQSEQAWYVNIEQFGKIGTFLFLKVSILTKGMISIVIRSIRKAVLYNTFDEEGLFLYQNLNGL